MKDKNKKSGIWTSQFSQTNKNTTGLIYMRCLGQFSRKDFWSLHILFFFQQYLTSPYHRDICVLMCSYFLQFKFFLHSENIFKFFFIKSNTIENVFSWYWKKKQKKQTSILVKLIRESNVEDFVWQQSAVINILLDET